MIHNCKHIFRIIFTAILLLVVNCTRAQFEKDINTVNALLKSSHDFVLKPGRVEADLHAAIALAIKAENISIKTGYKQGTGNSYAGIADAYNNMNNHAAARPYAGKAVDILNKYGNDSEKVRAYIILGGTYDNNEDDLPKKIFYISKPLNSQKKMATKKLKHLFSSLWATCICNPES